MSELKDLLINISEETRTKIIPSNIKEGITIFGVEGSLNGGIDTSDATATSADLLEGKSAYANDLKIEGTMQNLGTQTITPGIEDQEINNGYIERVTILGDRNLIEENIKKGVTLFGIEGNLDNSFDMSDATATSADILSGKKAYIADGTLAIGTMPYGSQYSKFREVGHNASQSYISLYPSKGYYDGSALTGIFIPLKSKWTTNATDEHKRFINELFAELGITPEILKAGTTLYTITGNFSSDATATSSDIVIGKTAYVNGELVTGTLAANTPIEIIDTLASSAVIAAEDPDKLTLVGTANANGIVTEETPIHLKATHEQVAGAIGLVPDILKAGTNILGVEGTYGSEASEYNGKFEIPATVPANFTITHAITSIETLDTSGLVNTYRMFADCQSLKSLPEMDLDQVTNASCMCQNCINLSYTPLMNLSRCSNVANFFQNCGNMTKANIIMPTVQTSVNAMFYNCYSLTELPAFDYSRINNSKGSAGGLTNYCYNCTNLTSADLGGIYTYARYGHSFTNAFYNCTNLRTFRGLKHIAVQVGYPASYVNMFYNCTNLEIVRDCQMYVPNLTSTFENCHNLIGFENCNVYGMGYNGVWASNAFKNCFKLTNIPTGIIDLLSFESNISNIFENCYSLQFNNAIYMNFCNSKYSNASHNIFANCKSIENIHIIGVNCPYYTHYAYNWFSGCTNLKNITIESLPVSLQNAFVGCENLRTVNIVNSSYTHQGLFRNSGILSVVDSIINNGEIMSNRILPNYYYTDCYKLRVAGNINLDCYNSVGAFTNCYNLSNLEGTTFYNVCRIDNMFINCTNITSVNNIITAANNGFIGCANTFAGCINLTDLGLIDMSDYSGKGSNTCPFGHYESIVAKSLPSLDKLINFAGFGQIGNNYTTVNTINSAYAAVDIVGAPHLSYESILNITTNLANLYTVFNITEGSAITYPQLIRMEINQYNKLTETDITNIQAKGWDISVHTIPAE